MRKAISFLGFNPNGYSRTCYTNRLPSGKATSFETELFAEALVALYQPDELYVLLTPTAENKFPRGTDESTWQTLKTRLNGKVTLVPVRGVPEGAEATDFWTLFDLVAGCVQSGDTVLFDLTHGMRSLPVIALAALLYLKSACGVTIEALLYGAFEASQDGNTPIVDLAPLVTLLEWASAAETFGRTGETTPLARSLQPHLPDLALPLEKLSEALALARPAEIAHEARRFTTALQKQAHGVHETRGIDTDSYTHSESPEVRPLRLLENALKEATEPLAADDPEKAGSDPRRDIALLWRQIHWNLTRGRTSQAAMLAREWIVTVECLRLGQDPTSKSLRLQMDKRISNHRYWYLEGSGNGDAELDALPGAYRRAHLWKALTDCRNDHVHCGMLDSSGSARKMHERVRRLEPDLANFAREIGILL